MSAADDRFSALERRLIGELRYDAATVAALAGVTDEEARRMWRAMGFPDAPDGEVLFTDLDVDMLRSACALVEERAVDDAVLIQLTRAIGQSESRVAESQVRAVTERARTLAQQAGAPADAVTELMLDAAADVLPRVEQYVSYGWRRHLVASLARQLAVERETADQQVLTVGFADLVGFTSFSQEADEAQLSAVVDRFEEVAYDRIAVGGGRVIKMIGDEVFFAVDDPVAGAEIGLDLAEAYAADPAVPDVRVGLASGPVVARAGDLLGPAVNLASRLVNIARPGSVLVSPEMADAVAGHDHLQARSLRRPRSLKGIGRLPVFVLRRSE